MVVANTRSGATFHFDLRDPDQLASLHTLLSQGTVTALSLQGEGHTTALPCPKRFKRRPEFGVELLTNGSNEPIGERIFVQADDTRVNLTLTFSSKLVRCDLVKTGRMLYNPSGRR